MSKATTIGLCERMLLLVSAVGLGCNVEPPDATMQVPAWQLSRESVLSIGVVEGDENYELDAVTSSVRFSNGTIVVGQIRKSVDWSPVELLRLGAVDDADLNYVFGDVWDVTLDRGGGFNRAGVHLYEPSFFSDRTSGETRRIYLRHTIAASVAITDTFELPSSTGNPEDPYYRIEQENGYSIVSIPYAAEHRWVFDGQSGI